MIQDQRGARARRALSMGGALVFGVALHGCTLEVDVGSWIRDAADVDASNAREPDANVPDEAGAPEDAGCSADGAPSDRCAIDAGNYSSELLRVTPGPGTSYFAQGASLPAGEYLLSYEDGCWKSGVVAWTVNLGPEGYFLVSGEPEAPIVMAPGTVGTFAGLGAFSSYEECVSANLGQPAVTFSFTGGRLGLRLESTPEDLLIMRFLLLEGARSPVFRLTCVGSCR